MTAAEAAVETPKNTSGEKSSEKKTKKKKKSGPALALKVFGLVKRYGRIHALNGLDITVPKGVICGFIGPNGAGKTTTFGILGGLIRPDAGEIDVLGLGPPNPERHGGFMSMLPQDCELIPQVPVAAYLRYLARLQGLSQAEAARTVDQRLEEVALTDRARSRIRELSHGMRRRVAVAQALLGEPELVLLDEPTSGLDPELVVRLRELFAAQRGKRTLVISSHNLLELEAVCDHIIFIQQGRCVRSGSIAEVTQRGLLMRYLIERPFDLSYLKAQLGHLEFTGEGSELLVKAPDGWTAARINATVIPFLVAPEIGLLEVRQGQSLEAAYMADQPGGYGAKQDEEDEEEEEEDA
jgi:ABC-type multidrug transport system ATPase subunit